MRDRSDPTPNGSPARLITAASETLAAVEKPAAGALVASIALLILLNVFTRYAGLALYWVDEAAIYAMVWATLIAGSLCVRRRKLVSMTLLHDTVPAGVRHVLLVINDLIVLVFAVFLLWLCWRWFAPLEMLRAGFDVNTFLVSTGNFIYGEPTNTLGIRKFWVWLIMPIFALTTTVHGLANLIETAGSATGRAAGSRP
ncbi:TRAP transporter small permease [Arhodomonas sp. SL1]|uniref:TRAP transporter small permease n=1 Tax=Arhodomonas sp. SL1 TaxID=3425691 RepID=UPI003F885888